MKLSKSGQIYKDKSKKIQISSKTTIFEISISENAWKYAHVFEAPIGEFLRVYAIGIYFSTVSLWHSFKMNALKIIQKF